MSEQIVSFDPDKKEHLLKVTKDLYFAAGQLHQWIKEDSLPEGMESTLPSLIESYFVDLAKAIDYESALTAEFQARHEEIRNANQRIHELERHLAESKPIEGLSEQLYQLHRIVYDWWSEYGFNHVSEFQFTSNGNIKLEFCFMLDHIRSYSETPATDRKNKKDRLQQFKDEGFDIVEIPGNGIQLIDNENNRKLLVAMLTKRFPSIKVYKFDNHAYDIYEERSATSLVHRGKPKDTIYALRHVEAYIYDLRDIPLPTGVNKN